ncbi:hypothetical protein [Limnohabitans sp.]|uniref:hypothetical protein n=1 Tax=Limnohabitans sp. TaxID=1907725 RepID=UPI00286F2C77|nr:hypothetical protein [Limnohabitans sp.]
MANLNAKPSFLGGWTNSTAVVSFYSQIPLGSSKLNGIVLGGWSYSGWSNTALHTVNIGVLEQGPDGLLRLNTAKYIADPATNGEGSVITTDINGDGAVDIFLAAHNESPLVPTASTVYLSQPDGSFKKVTLPDSVEAQSAILGNFNGVPTITTAGYGPTDPYYQFNTTTHSVDVKYWGGTHSGSLYGSSSVVGDFLGNGKSELVIGDFKTGPGYSFDPNGPTKLVVYRLNGSSLTDTPAFVAPLYFDQPRYQNKGFTSLIAGGLSHNYRTWTDDFNHDGKLDILAGVGIWSASAGWQKSKLQMFQNQGALNFTDVTDLLDQAYDENTSFVDYSMQILDIDKSGINSYLMAGDPNASGSKQSNYLMLNDGTGKLYAALHNEFQGWAINGANKFIAYQLSNGAINYVAQNANGDLYNLPLQYVAATDFKQNIAVADRNNSTLMRTWAGNDTFTDTNANGAPAHIDGGLGLDTSNYSKPSSSYQVKRSADGSVSVVGNGLSDKLVNVERLQFTDKTLALDINDTAGQAYRIYQAA